MDAKDQKVFRLNKDDLENAVESWLRDHYQLDGFGKESINVEIDRDRFQQVSAYFNKEIRDLIVEEIDAEIDAENEREAEVKEAVNKLMSFRATDPALIDFLHLEKEDVEMVDGVLITHPFFTEAFLYRLLDSTSYFNSLVDDLIYPVATDMKGKDIIVLGPNAHKLISSPQFKHDWLNMDPEIRRTFSENGICPLGVEKEQCRNKWKSGKSLDKLLHKDVGGLRVEISSTKKKVFFLPRSSGKISFDDLFDIYIEVKQISEDYDLEEVKRRKVNYYEDGLSFNRYNDYIEFTHTGSRYLSLDYLRRLIEEPIKNESSF